MLSSGISVSPDAFNTLGHSSLLHKTVKSSLGNILVDS